jgi:hypothetical protein
MLVVRPCVHVRADEGEMRDDRQEFISQGLQCPTQSCATHALPQCALHMHENIPGHEHATLKFASKPLDVK